MHAQDDSQRLREQVVAAQRDGQRLRIVGHGSKAHLVPGFDAAEHMLSTVEHVGIEDYVPDELVLRVRAGTPLVDLKRLLAQQGQELAFDPPTFGGRGTVGGAVASALAGPARPWRGGVRDAVLGVELINGLGQRLRFGGEVMKNVAGYDVSRLQAGAWGTLGLLLSVSLRLHPIATVDKTLHVELQAADDAYAVLGDLSRRSLPLAGLSYDPASPRQLALRLAGPPHVIGNAAGVGRDVTGLAAGMWQRLRDEEHAAFARGPQPLWRVSLPWGAPALRAGNTRLVDWGGAQRWVDCAEPQMLLREVEHLGGFARPYPSSDPLTAARAEATALSARLRTAFDPQLIFNRSIGPCDAD